MSKEKILLIQLFSNGDCLFVTTIAKQIKKNNPDCELTWIVSSRCSSMLLQNPDVDIVEEVEITDVSQNRIVFEQVVKEARIKKQAGVYAQVIVPQLLGTNLKFYNGVVCTSLFKSSGLKIDVDTRPVLILDEKEKTAAKQFAEKHQLQIYKNVVLFECAPQTNQLLLTDELILGYAKQVVKNESTCVILSAPKAYHFQHPQIINGNVLSIRETVALTHYCTLLLGCSSGISWAATSIAAKSLPTVQLLAKNAYYFNPLSLTFFKLKRSADTLIEMIEFDKQKLSEVFEDIFSKGFQQARSKHHQQVQVQFRLYRGIINGFLKEGKCSEIVTFVKINYKEHGFNFQMLKYMLLGIVLFPFQWIMDDMIKINKS